jgi:capsid portal protein
MGLFGQFKKEESVQVTEVGGYQSFSTPFLKMPSSNLSLPFIDSRYQSRGYVPFGEDNLAPQHWNQLYYVSPLHSAIVNFIVNAVCGGGYDVLTDGLSAKDKVNAYTVEKVLKFRKNVKPVLLDLMIHQRVYFALTLKDGKLIKSKRVGAEKVRVSNCKTKYFVNDDWQYSNKFMELTPYHPECKDGTFLYVYENLSLGQDIYPIPSYTSANNWIYLDGEMSYLHKSNIQNSVFPSFALMFPKKPQGKEEMELIKSTVEKMKGAENAGKAVAFFANNKEQLPELVTVPTNSNDQLFIQTDGRIDEKICQAWNIDPLIMGIRVSGKLGSGMELEQSYQTFEKNTIIPLRKELEEIFNDILTIGGTDAQFVCVEYRIIGDSIVETTQTKREE